MELRTSHTAPRRALPRIVRCILGLGYLVAIVVCMDHPDSPRWMWTMAMPLLPLFVVGLGFHTWRRLCPLATIGSLGARFGRRRRALPKWMQSGALGIAFALLLLGLLFRHIALNGDHEALGCSLLVMALGAILCNLAFSGKTWCNVFCPVGVVERIYTDGGSLRPTTRSACGRCTGCKPKCPDIDQDRAYRGELSQRARRLATYALPGLVFAFYAYYRLRHGHWEAFFDGAWSQQPVDRALILGPGFTFAPRVPALVAASLTLLSFSTLSFALFAIVERVLSARTRDHRRLRHRLLTVASFVAFNCFYLFAGQPTLRHFPVLDRILAFAVPVLSTLVLARRWSSTAGMNEPPRSLPVLPPTPRSNDDVAPHVPSHSR